MADLSLLQATKSYSELYGAATELNNKIKSVTVTSPDSTLTTLKSLTAMFSTSLLKPESLPSFGQLQAQVDLTDCYLGIYKLFAKGIETITDASVKKDINQYSHELRIQYNQLKVSLAAIDDDSLDNLISPCSDPLFLGFLKGDVKNWTNEILSNRTPALSDSQVQELINAWGNVVSSFVENAQDTNTDDKVNIGDSKTIESFFCIHERLETLYGRLGTNVSLVN
jgi:hypothetical protein